MGDWEKCFGSCSVEFYGSWSPCDDCPDEGKCNHCPQKGDFATWAVREMAHEEESEYLQDLGKDLIEIKEEIRILQKREKEIKSKIKSSLSKKKWLFVKSPSDETKDYIIEKVLHKPPSNLKKDLTLKLIEKKAGKELANLINEQCSYSNKYREIIYVRPYLEKKLKPNRVYKDIDFLNSEEEFPEPDPTLIWP